VRSAYPGYTGARPKMQVWHGTADNLLYPQNFWEEIKQWTNVCVSLRLPLMRLLKSSHCRFGYTQTPISNTSISGFPSTYSNATYGPMFQVCLRQL
jgi:acetylxylan esterase